MAGTTRQEIAETTKFCGDWDSPSHMAICGAVSSDARQASASAKAMSICGSKEGVLGELILEKLFSTSTLIIQYQQYIIYC